MTPETPAAAEGRPCLNCGAALTGRFCAHCSQAADVHVPSTRELIHEALEGITHSDSRLWRTLHLLWLKPGKLTQEFVAGRRASYLPPFRLYLILSIAFFLIASASKTEVRFVRLDGDSSRMEAVPPDCARLNATQFEVKLFGHDWTPRFRHRYAEHLLFFLHLHAFFFSLMTVAILSADAADAWPRLKPALDWVTLLFWTLPLYAVIAMRRVFSRSWAGTLAKAAALSAVYMVVFGVTLAGVFLYAVLQL